VRKSRFDIFLAGLFVTGGYATNLLQVSLLVGEALPCCEAGADKYAPAVSTQVYLIWIKDAWRIADKKRQDLKTLPF
jgi:hypothetical protein